MFRLLASRAIIRDRIGILLAASTTFSLSIGLQPRLVTKLDNSSSSDADLETKEKSYRYSAPLESTEFWSRILTSDTTIIKDIADRLPIFSSSNEVEHGKYSSKMNFQSIAGDFLKLWEGGDVEKQTTVTDLIRKVGTQQQGSKGQDSFSFNEVLQTLDQHKDLLKAVADKYVSEIDLTKLTPMSVAGYIEYEDEKKNPSWKRRAHRFCRPIEMGLVEQLHDALEISILAYADNIDAIVDGLGKLKEPCELVDAQVKSAPGEPAWFIAVKRNQLNGGWGPLEVIMAVRGTKTLADALTDMLCDSVPYRDGKAHQFIVKAGMYLVNKHTTLLEELCKKSGKSKIKLTLIGHSLGAGAASIAGLEFNDNKNIDVEVVGFGCPALLSRDLAEKATFITTVVNDADCVPRMSAATIVNLLLGLMEFDWIPYAKLDMKSALEGLQKSQPSIFTNDFCKGLEKLLFDFMDDKLRALIQTEPTNRIEPELFPPGRVIHFYRDGYGFAASFVPNDFFDEIDVTRRMFDGYQQTLLEFMRQNKADLNFKFNSKQVSD